jgi:BrnA antitoxin of type II toxin-antitoxin system
MTNDILENPKDQFREAASQKAKAVLHVDPDVAEYFQSQFENWQGHANELLRFFMDTSQAKELEFQNFEQPEPEPAGWTASPRPPTL